jgi:hypothetical protein
MSRSIPEYGAGIRGASAAILGIDRENPLEVARNMSLLLTSHRLVLDRENSKIKE